MSSLHPSRQRKGTLCGHATSKKMSRYTNHMSEAKPNADIEIFDPPEFPDERPTTPDSYEYREFCARMAPTVNKPHEPRGLRRIRQELRTTVRFGVDLTRHDCGPLEEFSDVGGIRDAGVQAN